MVTTVTKYYKAIYYKGFSCCCSQKEREQYGNNGNKIKHTKYL